MKRFCVVLLIKHPSMDPKLISETLQMKPYVCGKAGDFRVTPKGARLASTWAQTTWNHVVTYEGDEGVFKEVDRMVTRLAPHQDFLRGIVREGGIAELSLQLPGAAHQGDSASLSLLRRMVDLELQFGLEVFPDWD